MEDGSSADLYLSLSNAAAVAKAQWEADPTEMTHEFRQAVQGSDTGEPWCAAFVAWCLGQVEETTGRTSSLRLSLSTLALWALNPLSHRVRPAVGFIPVWQLRGTSEGHTGIVVAIADASRGLYGTIEGNTSPVEGTPEALRNGNGVFAKDRHAGRMGAFELLGFLDPFA